MDYFIVASTAWSTGVIMGFVFAHYLPEIRNWISVKIKGGP